MQIRFGALAPSLKEQIGDLLPRKMRGIHLRRWQHDADAITRLSVRGYIPERVTQRARRQVMLRISKALHDSGYRGTVE